MTRIHIPPLRNIRKLSSPKRKTVLPVSKKVKVSSSLFVMEDHTDYGQLLKPELNTNYMWDCDLANNTYKTPKSGGDKYKDGKEDNSKNATGESYLESALGYEDGFTMTFGYAFDRSYPTNEARKSEYPGYVQADVKKDGNLRKKLSFVGNGGVKFGSKAGAGDGVFEAAILDVEAWYNAQGSAMKIEDTVSSKGVTTLGAVLVSDYDQGPLSRLMNGVGYGRSYSSFFPEYPIIESDYWNYLTRNREISGTSGSMTIDAAAVTDSHYGMIKIYTNDVLTYSSEQENLPHPTPVVLDENGEPKKNENGESVREKYFDGKIYLQAHWGSGVIYQNVSIDPKKNSAEGEEA